MKKAPYQVDGCPVLAALGTADAHLMSVRGRPLITQTERKDTAIEVVVAGS